MQSLKKGIKSKFPSKNKKSIIIIDTQEIIDSTVSAANHFNVSRKTIRNWINKNYLIRWDS